MAQINNVGWAILEQVSRKIRERPAKVQGACCKVPHIAGKRKWQGRMTVIATMAPERTLQTKGQTKGLGDGVAKESRKKLFFSRTWRFPETGILINCHICRCLYFSAPLPLSLWVSLQSCLRPFSPRHSSSKLAARCSMASSSSSRLPAVAGKKTLRHMGKHRRAAIQVSMCQCFLGGNNNNIQ